MSTRITHTFAPSEVEEYKSNSGGSSYAELEPGIYDATLTKVETYDNRSKGKTHGWILTFTVEGLPFKTWVAVTAKAMWKIAETVAAFDKDAAELVEQGTIDFDFSDYIGMTVVGEIKWQNDPDEHPSDLPNYKELDKVWAPAAHTTTTFAPPAQTVAEVPDKF